MEQRPVGNKLTPPLKFAGGKRWLAPHIAELYHASHKVGQSPRKLFEPFCGGLAVALEIMPKSAHLNDVNPHLINFYKQIRLHGLHMTTKMAYDEELYYTQRKRFNELIKENRSDSQHAAELFYYLNRTCFNGLCRFNSTGGFNVPFGRYTTVNYAKDFKTHQEVFRWWQFSDVDFEVLNAVHPTDFIYADPPYDVVFTTYSKGGFSWDDQVRLFNYLCRHRGPVVVSNQATDRIIELYSKKFKIETLLGPRRINNTGDRTPALEMLATKNL